MSRVKASRNATAGAPAFVRLADGGVLVWSVLPRQYASMQVTSDTGDIDMLCSSLPLPDGTLLMATAASESADHSPAPHIGIHADGKLLHDGGATEAPTAALLQTLASAADSRRLDIDNSYWLAPNLLYFDGASNEPGPLIEPVLLVIDSTSVFIQRSRFVQLSDSGFACVVVFPSDDAATLKVDTELLWLTAEQLVRISKPAPQAAPALELTEYLVTQVPHAAEPIRNIVCSALVDFCTDDLRARHRTLIGKLQLMVELPPISCNDVSNPFCLHIDVLIPLGAAGVFVSGWMHDPLQLLESVSMTTAFGTVDEVQHHFHRVPRHDVATAYQDAPYGPLPIDVGIAAFIALPAHTAARLQDLATVAAAVFTVQLQSGISHTIRPRIDHRDSSSARDFIARLVPADFPDEALLTQCLGPAAALLHRQHVDSTAVVHSHAFGKQLQAPRVSLVIPLYERLDFLKVQFATFANDADFSADVEVIYVLDSPWQEAHAHATISELSTLYRLPVRLLVMNRNSGYAAATNAGAAHANGEHLVLLNSDVFPAQPRWVSQLRSFYMARRTIGALAPKLLFEDDSLQHAGMYFTRGQLPYWQNLHYYKGYPRNFAAACVNRVVPAVTGACLMLARSVWDRVGGLSTDYIIGDFEDSDLCLKLSELGLENWYCADVELYHPERQSMPLNAGYHGSLAWRLNAHAHTGKWNFLIEELMARHSEV